MSMLNGLEQETILRCPGCERWQLHYTPSSVADLVDWRVPADRTKTLLSVNTKAVDECIEFLLREHVAHECTHPRKVMELWKKSGGKP